jgi:5'-nucleotidase
MHDRPLILCSNDDGFFSRGLRASVSALRELGRVVVVAPETEQSATSHSLTLHRPLRLRRVEEDWYALDGTPADCVYLALHLGETDAGAVATGENAILPRKPDLVVSGINRGINLGQDVFYSGTVAAAREGALRGIPSIAGSVQVTEDPSGAVSYDATHVARLVTELGRALLERGVRDGEPTPLLNVNAPAGPIGKLVSAKLGLRLWVETVDARLDPRGRPYFWIGGKGASNERVPGSDTEAFDAGFASITALSLDLARRDPHAHDLVDTLIQRASLR